MNKNRIIGIVLGLVGLLFLLLTSRLPINEYATVIGPRVFPYIASGGLFLCAVGLFFRKETEEEKKKGPFLDRAGWIRVLKLCILLAFFPLLFKYLGYIISSCILLFLMITFFDLKKEVKAWKRGLVTVIVVGILYTLFTFVIKIKLPTGDLIDLII